MIVKRSKLTVDERNRNLSLKSVTGKIEMLCIIIIVIVIVIESPIS